MPINEQDLKEAVAAVKNLQSNNTKIKKYCEKAVKAFTAGNKGEGQYNFYKWFNTILQDRLAVEKLFEVKNKGTLETINTHYGTLKVAIAKSNKNAASAADTVAKVNMLDRFSKCIKNIEMSDDQRKSINDFITRYVNDWKSIAEAVKKCCEKSPSLWD